MDVIYRQYSQGYQHEYRQQLFPAQQVVMLLGNLAHNVIVWALHWLASLNSATTASCVWCMMSLISVAFSSGMLPAQSGRSFSIALLRWPSIYVIRCWSFWLRCMLPLLWAKLRELAGYFFLLFLSTVTAIIRNAMKGTANITIRTGSFTSYDD
jgi:hypothetical protein